MLARTNLGDQVSCHTYAIFKQSENVAIYICDQICENPPYRIGLLVKIEFDVYLICQVLA